MPLIWASGFPLAGAGTSKRSDEGSGVEWPRSDRPGGRRGRSPEQPTDAVVRLTMSAICGTDLHMVRGTMPGKQPGTVLGHEGVGVVEAVGSQF